jgi:hypothetical protein
VHLAWHPWSGRIEGKAADDKEKDATPETRATVSAAASSRRGIETIRRWILSRYPPSPSEGLREEREKKIQFVRPEIEKKEKAVSNACP